MDASAYLKRQGWRGDGHSLDLTNRGIRKPLLISKKIDVLGLGVNKHAAVSDQWWMRAFDQGLQNLGTGKESALSSVRKHGIHNGGLYGRFVEGESVPGTIGTKGWSSCVSGDESVTTPADSGIETVEGARKKRRMDKHEAQKKAARSDLGVTTLATQSVGERSDKALHEKKLSSTKRGIYEKRAKEKGLTVEEYVRRREKKYAARKNLKVKRPP